MPVGPQGSPAATRSGGRGSPQGPRPRGMPVGQPLSTGQLDLQLAAVRPHRPRRTYGSHTGKIHTRSQARPSSVCRYGAVQRNRALDGPDWKPADTRQTAETFDGFVAATDDDRLSYRASHPNDRLVRPARDLQFAATPRCLLRTVRISCSSETTTGTAGQYGGPANRLAGGAEQGYPPREPQPLNPEMGGLHRANRMPKPHGQRNGATCVYRMFYAIARPSLPHGGTEIFRLKC
jgi:hypothetical protein